MKITVFGATGSIGQNVVKQALEAGHEVTAFVRSPSKLEIKHANLRIVQGDVVKDDERIRTAVAGRDSVIVSLGAGIKGGVRSTGTKKIIAAMKQEGVQHLVCQSTLGAGDSAAQLDMKWWFIFRGPLRWAMADHEQQEQYVRSSGLDWTIVRPGSFTDGPLTGKYQNRDASWREKLTLKISRADVAHFLLKQLGDRQLHSKAVTLSY